MAQAMGLAWLDTNMWQNMDIKEQLFGKEAVPNKVSKLDLGKVQGDYPGFQLEINHAN